MEGSDEVGEEGLEEFDEECLQSCKQVIDVCELKNALICHLRNTRTKPMGQTFISNTGMKMLRTTNMSSRSFTKVHLTAYPSFSYLSPVVRPSMRASRMSELTGEAGDEASWDAAGVNERDQRTTPPMNNLFDYVEGSVAEVIYLCGRLSSGRASCVVLVCIERDRGRGKSWKDDWRVR